MESRIGYEYDKFGGPLSKQQEELCDLLRYSDRDDREIKDQINRIFEKSVRENNLWILGIILCNGVRIEPLNDENQTAIHIAAEMHNWRVVKTVFSYCNTEINYIDKNGFSHFHIACLTGNVNAVKRFLSNGVDVNNRFHSDIDIEPNLFTPLHFAVKYPNLEIVELLLANNADVNATDYFGRTPLHLACEISEEIGRKIKANVPCLAGKMSKEFLNLIGKENVKYWDSKVSVTSAVIVIQCTTLDILKLLVKNKSNVNLRDRNGNTPLFYIFHDRTWSFMNKDFSDGFGSCSASKLAYHRFVQTIKAQLMIKQEEKFMFLVEKGADVTICNNNYNTLLHHAIKSLNTSSYVIDFVEAVPCFNYNVSNIIEFVETVPCFNYNITNIIEKLLIQGVNVDARNKNDKTPLQLAISMLRADVVNVLLKYRANISSLNFDNGNEYFFLYPNLVPDLEATVNLIEIVNALTSRGFHFKLLDKLVILEFFICKSNDYSDNDNWNMRQYKTQKLLELGTDLNIINMLYRNKSYVNFSDFVDFSKYMYKIKECELYVSTTVETYLKTCVKPSNISRRIVQFKELYEEEADKMKVTMLNNGMSLLDILLMYKINPDKFYSCFEETNYEEILLSPNFEDEFREYGGIIKGYFAKGLVRKFVLEWMNDYIKLLTRTELPDSCCQQIARYLSNEDLWNLCLSTIDGEPKWLGKRPISNTFS